MADEIEVGIGTALDPSAQQDLIQIAEQLRSALTFAQQLGESFKTASTNSAGLTKQITQLKGELRDALKAGDKVRELVVRDRLNSTQETLDIERGVLGANKLAGATRSAQKNALLERPAGDGRTFGQAKLEDDAVRLALTAINTSADQIGARLAEGAAKASERLVRAAQATMFAELDKAKFAGETALRDHISRNFVQREIGEFSRNQRVEARFGQSLDQFAGVAPAALPVVLAEAERQQRTARFRDDNLRKDAEDENRRRDRLNRFHDDNLRKDAEDENRRRDRLNRFRDDNLRKDAEYENRRRDRQVRQARLEADPSFAARIAGRDAAFETRYGLSRDEFAERTLNLPLKERVQLLRQLQDEQRKLNAEERRSAIQARPAAPLRPPKTLDQKIAEGNEYRSALADSPDFFGFQTKLATNYLIFGSVVAGAGTATRAIAQFDDVLKQFQAVTQTTNTETEKFRKTLLDIGLTSRFSVNELAQAAITLGQTGLSASDVARTLQPVVNLATASGSTLKEAVDVITAVLGAYNMEAGRAAEISNVFVEALNRSKLTMEQLSLGIQYSANIAREAGISYSELTAIIASIAQAGVKSGSTLGTGTRQLIQELISPSEKLRGVLKQLDISFADIDIQAHGLVGVLENLRTKGFGTAEALRALDLRAASAFSALVGQTDGLKRLQEAFLLSNAANEAAAKANESLIATLTRAGNALFAVTDRAFNPFLEAIKAGAAAVPGLVSALDSLIVVLPAVGSGLAAVAVAAGALRIGTLLGIGSGLAMSGPAGLAIGAAAAAAAGLYAIVSSFDTIEKRMDRLKALQNDLQSDQQKNQTALQNLDRDIQKATISKDRLNSDPLLRRNTILEAQQAFKDLGLSVSANAEKIEELIDAYRRLRGELQNKEAVNLTKQYTLAAKQLEVLLERNAEERKAANSNISKALGFGGERTPQQMQAMLRLTGLEEFTRVLDLIQNPSLIDSKDPFKSTQETRDQLSLRRFEAQNEALPLSIRRANGEPLAPTESTRLDTLQGRMENIGALSDLLEKVVRQRANEESARISLSETGINAQVSRLAGTPELQDLHTSGQKLRDNAKVEADRILGDRSLDGIAKNDKLIDLVNRTRELGTNLLIDLDSTMGRLSHDGVPDEVLKRLKAKYTDLLGTLSKGVTKELDELHRSVTKEATAEYQAKRKSNEALTEQYLRRAASSRDIGEINFIEAEVLRLLKARQEIEQKIIELEIANPTLLSPEQKRKIEETKDALQSKMNDLAGQLTERRKNLQKEILTVQDTQLKGRFDLINSEKEKLEKQLSDARLTPQKAEELVKTINRLIDEATEIANRRIDLKTQIDAAKPVQATLPDQLNAAPGTVPNQIITYLRDQGRDELIPYMLGAGQLESSLNPNARNGNAKGLFQFMNGPSVDTWKEYGAGDVYDVANQLVAMVRFTDASVKAFRQAFGQDPTDAEKFVLHNQGAAGGVRLLQNPNTPARDIVGDGAVTGNRGSLDMSAAEFVAHLQRMYLKAADRTLEYTTNQRSVDRQKAVDAKQGEVEKADREKKRVQDTLDEINRRKIGLSLDIDSSEIDKVVGLAKKAVKEATDSGELQAAADRFLQSTGEARDNAVAKLGNDNRFQGLPVDEQQRQIEGVNARFRLQAEREILENAKQMRELTEQRYRDNVADIDNQLKSLDLARQYHTISESEYDLRRRQLDDAKLKLQLEGEEAGKRAEIAEIERELALLDQKGLGTSAQAIDAQARKNVLLREELRLRGLNNQTRTTLARGEDLGTATDTAINSFGKSRGILNSRGEEVSQLVQYSKILESTLTSAANAFDNFFSSVATGTMRVGDAFRKMATDMLSDLAKLASRAVTNELFKMLLGLGGGASAGGGLFDNLSASDLSAENGFAQGGFVRAAQGLYQANRDSVPALLMPGEYVLRKSAVDAIGRGQLDQINRLGNSTIARPEPADPKAPPTEGGGGGLVNIWVVSPDQVPPPGPRDIVAAVADDVQRGGSIKQLIRQVAVGAI